MDPKHEIENHHYHYEKKILEELSSCKHDTVALIFFISIKI